MSNIDKIAAIPPRTVIKPDDKPSFNVFAIINATVMPGVIAIIIEEITNRKIEFSID